jgi:FMN phosphatase YigB (HAD superfamily)
LAPDFADVRLFISTELGWSKPALTFFQAIANDMNFAPEAMLMIGDDWHNDVNGALQAGWSAGWLSADAAAKLPAESRSITTFGSGDIPASERLFRVSHLGEVPSFVEDRISKFS